LAIAAAMARRPALLISDESTSMLDAAGRAEILDLLASLPARSGTAVVHVTHDPAEAARADRVVGLAGGRIIDATVIADPAAAEHSDDEAAGTRAPDAGTAERGHPSGTPGEPVIRVRGV